MTKTKAVIQSMRIPFLALTPVCVFLGMSTVYANQGSINIPLLFTILSGALLAHISVNTLNEYSDFKSGLDFNTKRTRFSGGSGALPRTPEAARAVLTLAIFSLMATIAIGCFFILKYGSVILPIGVIGLILIITYTRWLNKYPLLCLISPGTGFGLLMVLGTHLILGGENSLFPWLVAMIPFFLINNLLLLNQYPDIEADNDAGRNHFPIAYGIGKSNLVFAFSIFATLIIITSGVITGYFPTLSFISLLPLPLAIFSLYGALKYGRDIGNHPEYLATDVITALLTPLLLGLSFIYG